MKKILKKFDYFINIKNLIGMVLINIGNYICRPLKKISKSQCYISQNNKYFIKQSTRKMFADTEKHLMDNLGMYGHTRTGHTKPVIPIYETYKFKGQNYIVYPFINGSDLQIKKFNAKIWMDILFSIKYIHRNNIAHCDIKPENFMYHNNTVYIFDFEFGRLFKNSEEKKLIKSRFGTLSYVSPEVYNRSYVTLKSDIYSIGKMYYISRTGDYTFNYKNNSWIGEDEKDIISMMTEENSDKRPDINECINYFQYLLY